MWGKFTYKELKEIESVLLYKRIIAWNDESITLEDGTVVSIQESEQDCCATARGKFTNVQLDAAITNIEYGEIVHNEYDGGENDYKLKITLLHNQNEIAQADLYADDGNGGYYYSVGSLVVGDIHYKALEA